MKVKLSCTILTLFVYTCLVECKRTKRNWEGVLAFTEDFDGFEIKQDSWTFADWCHGKVFLLVIITMDQSNQYIYDVVLFSFNLCIT